MMKKLIQRGLPFRNQGKMGVLVVGFLGLMFIGNRTFTYPNDNEICNKITDIPKSECKALVDFYESINGDEWKKRARTFSENRYY